MDKTLSNIASAPIAPEGWSVRLHYEFAAYAARGLIPIFFYLKAPENNGVTDLKLLISVEDETGHSVMEMTKTVSFASGQMEADFWLALHTHLLNNGLVTIKASILDNHEQPLTKGALEITVRNTGPLAEMVRENLRQFGTPVLLDGVCDSRFYPYAQTDHRPWFDQPDAEEMIVRWQHDHILSPAESDMLRQFVRDGFIILPDVLPDDLTDQANAELDQAVAQGWDGYEYGRGQKLQHLHEHFPAIRQLWTYPSVMRILNLIFQSPPVPCHTLSLLFGTEQEPHQDTIHLTPFPAGYMCGVWMALEDITEGSGELYVYAGSHREKRIYLNDSGFKKTKTGHWRSEEWRPIREKMESYWQSMADRLGNRKIIYRPKRGTIMIWHENLLHGGGPRTNRSLTRRSIVGHYFAEGAVAYYDSTGMFAWLQPREKILSPLK